MKLTVDFIADGLAVVTEHRWWWLKRQYTVALYGNALWVRDCDNRPVSERVADQIERQRALGRR